MIEGHSLSLALPFHPPYIHRHQLYPIECSYSGAYWFQNQCPAQLERGSAGCRLTNFALNTNTDCFGRRLCCHSICPRGIRCYVSAPLFLAPTDKHLLSSPTPLFPPPPLPLGTIWHSFVIVTRNGHMQTKICGESPVGHPHLIFSTLPPSGGCHGGSGRWRRKERESFAASQSVICQVDMCVQV